MNKESQNKEEDKKTISNFKDTDKKSLVPKSSAGAEKKHKGQMSEYGIQMLEKQSIKKVYGVSEKQFKKYVEQAQKSAAHIKLSPAQIIYNSLERRLDNIVFRMGLTKTRRSARQMVSHGHILVNGRKNNIPSHKVEIGDVISIREGSKNTKLFNDYLERFKDLITPNYLEVDASKLQAKVLSLPKEIEAGFDFAKVLEFYNK